MEQRAERQASLASIAYAQIKRRIIRLEIPPGTGFTEAGLARDLGLSKTPVRRSIGPTATRAPGGDRSQIGLSGFACDA